MTTMFGRTMSRRDLMSRIGGVSQIAGIRMMTLADGAEAGVRIADVRTGSGLRFQVSVDRGMDISAAEYCGVPLAWRSAAGDVHPSYFDPRGGAWLRTFPGGLMTGCGMTYLGAPCVDEGTELGLHGRLSHLPAFAVGSSETWEGDDCVMALNGSMREATTFGENLLLRRTITTRLGESWIDLRDEVINEGTARTPLMMLYHINAGWPLVDEGTDLLLPAGRTVPRDDDARRGLADARRFSGPVAGYREQVFYHDLDPGRDGYGTVLLRNPVLKLALAVRFRMKELPRLVEWKMMGEGTYVVGVEPANCGVKGRADERAAGTLRYIEPAEQTDFHVQIGVLDGEAQISEFSTRNALR
ncbi:MAG: aldose 1-epimerase family protein [Bacteroidota bacterium]